jgi:hypothetical protein
MSTREGLVFIEEGAPPFGTFCCCNSVLSLAGLSSSAFSLLLAHKLERQGEKSGAGEALRRRLGQAAAAGVAAPDRLPQAASAHTRVLAAVGQLAQKMHHALCQAARHACSDKPQAETAREGDSGSSGDGMEGGRAEAALPLDGGPPHCACSSTAPRATDQRVACPGLGRLNWWECVASVEQQVPHAH